MSIFKVLGIVLILGICRIHGLKVLKTPKFHIGDTPVDAFATIANLKNISTSELTICVWVLNYYKEDSWFFEETSDKGIRLSVLQTDWFANYIKVGQFYFRFSFPQHFEWLPDIWAFFCFLFDNKVKRLSLYLNSEKIFENQEEEQLKDYKIAPYFLNHQKIGNAKHFAGQITKLNIWSEVLTPEKVKDVYSCKMDVRRPDIVDWETVSLNVGQGLSIENSYDDTELCDGRQAEEEQIYVFNHLSTMDSNKRALQICRAMGGFMEEPENTDEWTELTRELKII